jgi:hypothetical protein
MLQSEGENFSVHWLKWQGLNNAQHNSMNFRIVKLSFIYCQDKMAWRLTCKPFTCLHDMFSTHCGFYMYLSSSLPFLNPKIISWIHKLVINGNANHILQCCSPFLDILRAICIEGCSVLTTQQMEQWWFESQNKRSLSFCVLL